MADIYVPQLAANRAPTVRQDRVDVSSGIQAFGESVDQINARTLSEKRLDVSVKLEELKADADTKPWAERATHFQKGAEKIKAEAGKDLGFFSNLALGVQDDFDLDFAKLQASGQIDVNQSARKGQIDHNIALLDTSLDTYARQAATTADDTQSGIIQEQAAKAIAAAQQGGFLSEVQAGDQLRGFSRKLDVNRARSLIEVDPHTGLQALADTARFASLNAEDRLALVGRAEQKVQHAVALSDHAAIVGERNRKLMGDQIAKEGFDLVANGQMSEQWMSENRRVLDTSDYKQLRTAMQEGGGTDSAPVVANLFDRVYRLGDDIGPDVKAALQQRTISVDTARQLYNENKQTQDIPSARKQGLSYITTSLKASDANDDPVAAQRLANAVASFNQQMAEDPKQDPLALSRTIVKTQALLQWDQMNVLRPLPKYSTGDRMTFDPKAARAATAKAFLAKYGGDRAKAAADPDFIREGKLINDWEAARKRLEQANEAAKAKTK